MIIDRKEIEVNIMYIPSFKYNYKTWVHNMIVF